MGWRRQTADVDCPTSANMIAVAVRRTTSMSAPHHRPNHAFLPPINLRTAADWLPTVAKKADTVGWQSGKHGLGGQRSTGPTVGGCWRGGRVIDSCYYGEHAPAGNVQSLAVSIKLQHTDQYRDVARDKYSRWWQYYRQAKPSAISLTARVASSCASGHRHHRHRRHHYHYHHKLCSEHPSSPTVLRLSRSVWFSLGQSGSAIVSGHCANLRCRTR